MLRLNDKQMPYRRLLSCDATLPYAADCSKQYIRHDFLKYLLYSLSAHMANITHYRTISDKLLFCSLHHDMCCLSVHTYFKRCKTLKCKNKCCVPRTAGRQRKAGRWLIVTVRHLLTSSVGG